MTCPADEPVLISALQHYIYCPKQFAIIHVDKYWKENYFTADGQRLHKRVDLPGNHRSTGSRVEYALSLMSDIYGLSGKADAVEFTANGEVIPVEYKRGGCKASNCDKIQLCAQALCLEEMLHKTIKQGALFYFEKREKVIIPINVELRKETENIISSCRLIISAKESIPVPLRSGKCRACSLVEYCMPAETKKSASAYLKEEMQKCGSY